MTICVGDRVEKLRGYKWPGVVVAVFKTLAGENRIVVECTVREVAGALHIYSPEQVYCLAQKEEAPR
jgi:hypothetical protein